MLKRYLCLLFAMVVVGCVEGPESAAPTKGADMVDEVGDRNDMHDGLDADADAEADMGSDLDSDNGPDLSECICDAAGEGQILVSCDSGCEYACDEGFNQCPDEQLVCVPAGVDDPSNGLDDNCDGIVGVVASEAVFVAVDEDLASDGNDGLTPESPVETVDKALVIMEVTNRTRLILQAGNYRPSEGVVIDSTRQIDGGWTIEEGLWRPGINTRSRLSGLSPSQPTVTVKLDQPSEKVVLRNLELVGADATTTPGLSVFTLYIEGVEAQQLAVEKLRVVGGKAGPGDSGDDGLPGESGRDGSGGKDASNSNLVVRGGSGGLAPSCAASGFMSGGTGGDADRDARNGQAGRAGDNASSSGPAGGSGGDGGCNNNTITRCIFSSTDADPGEPGRKGAGGSRNTSLNTGPATIDLSGDAPVFVPKTVQSGQDGKPGSGGGGGGGGGSVSSTTAPSGGGGGAGGCGGGGGIAGQQGGASVAIVVHNSNVDLSKVEVAMGLAGKGGDGGDGAAGGCGGSGGTVFVSSSTGLAGSGGSGGPGGNGAGGDGAPGGPSYGVYMVDSTITGPDQVVGVVAADGGAAGKSNERLVASGSADCDRARAEDGAQGDDGSVEKVYSPGG